MRYTIKLTRQARKEILICSSNSLIYFLTSPFQGATLFAIQYCCNDGDE